LVRWQNENVALTEDDRREAFMLALTSEHFVLQGAASSTISEASARSTMYLLSLSSSLIATGFMSQREDVFIPFVAVVLPAVVVLGVFTIERLVETALENMQYMASIAHIRSYYRTLSPEAETYFDTRYGRWPEPSDEPALRLGGLFALLGTSASMIAFINNVVTGALVAVLVNEAFGGDHLVPAVGCGVVVAVTLMVLFLLYQRWRFSDIQLAVTPQDAADKAS
jgi:hypothetical protein